MKKNFLFFLLFFLSYLSVIAQKPIQIHRSAIVIDAHNDVLSDQITDGFDIAKERTSGNFDLVRARKGGLDAQVFSIWCGDSFGKGRAFARANREIDSLYSAIERNSDKMALVKTAKDLRNAITENKLAALIGVEGGHMIEDRLDYLDSLGKRGMIYLTLTWNNSTSWATSALDETRKKETPKHLGLTEFGKEVVARLNQKGIMVDVSHVGEKTFYDVLATSSKPVIASHSSAYSLNPHFRNLKDAQLKALAKNGGVVFVNFYSGFIDSSYFRKESEFLKRHKMELDSMTASGTDEFYGKIKLFRIHKSEYDAFRPSLSLLIKHIDYIAKLVGVDHVGLGADFDGAESYPRLMDDVSFYPFLTAELVKIGYSEKDIKKILGENFLRVLEANRS
jgi:membrane dipeptidase